MGKIFTVAAGTESTTLSVSVSSGTLTGAVDGEWRTDLHRDTQIESRDAGLDT